MPLIGCAKLPLSRLATVQLATPRSGPGQALSPQRGEGKRVCRALSEFTRAAPEPHSAAGRTGAPASAPAASERSGNAAASVARLAGMTPRSVMSPLTSRAGVTSKA